MLLFCFLFVVVVVTLIAMGVKLSVGFFEFSVGLVCKRIFFPVSFEFSDLGHSIMLHLSKYLPFSSYTLGDIC